MSIREELLKRQPFVVQSFMKLIIDETDRILAQNLADNETIKTSVSKHLADAMVKVPSDRPAALTALSDLHQNLKDVKLPGDFDKLSMEIMLLEPMGDESMGEGCGCEMKEEEEEPCMCEPGGCGEDAAHDCPCPPDCECKSEDEALDYPVSEEGSGPEGLSNMVLGRLEDIVYKLGRNGHHSAAYEIERAIETIVSNADIWGDMEKMEKNPPGQQQQKNPMLAPQQNTMQDRWNAANPAQQQKQPAQPQRAKQRLTPQQRMVENMKFNEQKKKYLAEQKAKQQAQPAKQPAQQPQKQAPQQPKQPAQQQKRPAGKADPAQLQQAAQSIRQKTFRNPKVPRAYKNNGTLMRVMQQMIQKGRAKDVAGAAKLLEKRLSRFK